jgi:hypothetical protein
MLYTDIASGYRQIDEASYSADAQDALDMAEDLKAAAAAMQPGLDALRKAMSMCSDEVTYDLIEAAQEAIEDNMARLRARAEMLRDEVACGDIA